MLEPELGICHEVRKLREGALPYWRPLYEARDLERAFLDGDRYVEDNILYNKDRRRQQFRGQETSNVNRHKAAQATAAPRSIEALPVDRLTDPDDSEIAVSIIEWEASHPQKGFDDVVEEVIQDAVDCRAGAALLDWDPDMGPYGETYWRYKDVNLLMWEPGFNDPHHLKCGWFQEVRRMHLSEVKAMGKLKGKAKWRVPKDLQADGQIINREYGMNAMEGSTRLSYSPDLVGIPGAPVDDEHIWILFCWYKNDTTTYKEEAVDDEIPPGERYMGCNNHDCDYRSDTQDELVEQGLLGQGEELPEDSSGMMCPQCGTQIERRDFRTIEDEVLIYPKGRRLVIQPLLQKLSEDEPLYDGGWPVPTARSFPLLYVTAYIKPGRPMGPSDTTLGWEAQVASDQLMTMAFDRIMRHQMYYLMPRTGIYDYRGQRYEYRDDQYNVMFYDTSDPNGPPPKPDVIEGSALDSAWPAYWNAVQQTLLGHQGISDFGLTPNSSKDIAASTVSQLNQMGEIPVAHFIRRKNRAMSKAYGVWWDYIRYTYKGDRLARLRLSDEFIVDKLKGDELPNFDFTVAETPVFAGIQKERNEAFQALLQIGQTMPHMLDVFAEVNQLPPSIVRKVRNAMMMAPPMPGMEQGATPGIDSAELDPASLLDPNAAMSAA